VAAASDARRADWCGCKARLTLEGPGDKVHLAWILGDVKDKEIALVQYGEKSFAVVGLPVGRRQPQALTQRRSWQLDKLPKLHLPRLLSTQTWGLWRFHPAGTPQPRTWALCCPPPPLLHRRLAVAARQEANGSICAVRAALLPTAQLHARPHLCHGLAHVRLDAVHKHFGCHRELWQRFARVW